MKEFQLLEGGGLFKDIVFEGVKFPPTFLALPGVWCQLHHPCSSLELASLLIFAEVDINVSI